jgi:CRP-like cAMP-binding protein
MASFQHSPNQLLAALPLADFELLRPHLQTIELIRQSVLVEAGEPVLRGYFPHSGVISSMVMLPSGEMVEVSVTGHNGACGATSSVVRSPATSMVVQLAGRASVIEHRYLCSIVAQSDALRLAMVRQEQLNLAELEQIAACNAVHGVGNRLARKLLRLRAISGSDTFKMTQEFLAQVLGARRNSVSLVASQLQQDGVIRYSRGTIEIVNVGKLSNAACECCQATELVDRACDREPEHSTRGELRDNLAD